MTGPLARLVAIPAFDGAETGVEIGRGKVEMKNGDVAGEAGIQSPVQLGRWVSPGRFESDDLTSGMNTGVGAARPHHAHALLRQLMEGLLDLALHRPARRLHLKAQEAGAIVFDQGAKVGREKGGGAIQPTRSKPYRRRRRGEAPS